jgi:preprotein translocase subunit SecG
LDTLKIVFVVAQLIVCVVLMTIIVIQSGKTSGLSGALAGGSDTFLSKNKGKTLDARLSRATKWVAGVFVVFTIVLNLM